jgi:hypothetical protein
MTEHTTPIAPEILPTQNGEISGVSFRDYVDIGHTEIYGLMQDHSNSAEEEIAIIAAQYVNCTTDPKNPHGGLSFYFTDEWAERKIQQYLVETLGLSEEQAAESYSEHPEKWGAAETSLANELIEGYQKTDQLTKALFLLNVIDEEMVDTDQSSFTYTDGIHQLKDYIINTPQKGFVGELAKLLRDDPIEKLVMEGSGDRIDMYNPEYEHATIYQETLEYARQVSGNEYAERISLDTFYYKVKKTGELKFIQLDISENEEIDAAHVHSLKEFAEVTGCEELYLKILTRRAINPIMNQMYLYGPNDSTTHFDTNGIATQVHILKYLMNSNGSQFNQTMAIIRDRTYRELAKEHFYEMFFSTEYGEDFADIVVNLKNNLDRPTFKEMGELFETFNKSAASFSGWFKDYDPALQQSVQQAMRERFLESMYVLAEVAENGPVSSNLFKDDDEDSSRDRLSASFGSVEEVMESVRLFTESLDRLRLVVNDPEVVVSKVVTNADIVGYQIFRFGSPDHGDTLLKVRQYGATKFDYGMEYGNKSGVEASISFSVNPVAPHHLSSQKDPNGVSIRFDREGRLPGEDPHSPDRSPIREDGSMSIDLSSILGDPGTAGVKMGRMIALGNILRSQRLGIETKLNHNTNYFDQEKYGPAEGFADFARYVRRVAEVMALDSGRRPPVELSRHLAAKGMRSAVKSAA